MSTFATRTAGSTTPRIEQLAYHARLFNERANVEWTPAVVAGKTKAELSASISEMLRVPPLENPAPWMVQRLEQLAAEFESVTGRKLEFDVDYLTTHREGARLSPRQRTLNAIESVTKQIRSARFQPLRDQARDELVAFGILPAAAAPATDVVEEPAAA